MNILTGPFGPGFMAQIPLFTTYAGAAADDPVWATAPAAAWMLLALLPSVAVASRRLHDANLSARWLFLLLVTPGVIVVMFMLAGPSRPGGIRFDRPAENLLRPAQRA